MASLRSPNGRLLLTRFTRGLKLWSEVNPRTVLIKKADVCLFVQDGVCKQTIDRSKTVSSVIWLPNGQGEDAFRTAISICSLTRTFSRRQRSFLLKVARW